MSESIFQQPLRPEDQPSRSNPPAQPTPPKAPVSTEPDDFDAPASFEVDEPKAKPAEIKPSEDKPHTSRFKKPQYLETGAFKTLSVSMLVEGILSMLGGCLIVIAMIVLMAAVQNGAIAVVTFLFGGVLFLPMLLNFILGISVMKLRGGNAAAAGTVSKIITFYRVLLYIAVALVILGGVISIVTAAAINVGAVIGAILLIPIPVIFIFLYARYLRGISEMARQIANDIRYPADKSYVCWVNVTGFAWFFASIALFGTFIQIFNSSSSTDLLSMLEDLGLNLRSALNMTKSEYYDLRDALTISAGIGAFTALQAGYSFIRTALIGICHTQIKRAHIAADAKKVSVSAIRPASPSMPAYLVSMLWIAVALLWAYDSHVFYNSMSRYVNFLSAGAESVFTVVLILTGFLAAIGLFLIGCAHLSTKAETTVIVGSAFALADVFVSVAYTLFRASKYSYYTVNLTSSILNFLLIAIVITCAIFSKARKDRAPLAIRITAPIVTGILVLIAMFSRYSFAALLFPFACLFTTLVIVNCRKNRAVKGAIAE